MEERAPDDLVFRRAGPDDVQAVVDLVESAFRGDVSREGWTTEADLLEGQRTDAGEVRLAIDDVDGMVLVAVLNGALVGCCHLVHRVPGVAYLGMVAVSPELQGRALGGAVLAEAERIAGADLGSSSVRMRVIRQREELIAWYRRRGYELTGETEPFPYGDIRFGIPRRDDLEFVVLEKSVG
jgi:ribosomal protein S18 acetylase RimI-like enzyme